MGALSLCSMAFLCKTVWCHRLFILCFFFLQTSLVQANMIFLASIFNFLQENLIIDTKFRKFGWIIRKNREISAFICRFGKVLVKYSLEAIKMLRHQWIRLLCLTWFDAHWVLECPPPNTKEIIQIFADVWRKINKS